MGVGVAVGVGEGVAVGLGVDVGNGVLVGGGTGVTVGLAVGAGCVAASMVVVDVGFATRGSSLLEPELTMTNAIAATTTTITPVTMARRTELFTGHSFWAGHCLAALVSIDF